eukprot:COSAG04_NODE_1036_length_8609_cov_33.941716_7_plen_42_part_00
MDLQEGLWLVQQSCLSLLVPCWLPLDLAGKARELWLTKTAA